MSRYLKGPLIYGAFNAEGVPSLHNVHRHIRVYGPCWNKWPSSSASRRATLAIRQYVHLPSGPSVNVSPPGILSVSLELYSWQSLQTLRGQSSCISLDFTRRLVVEPWASIWNGRPWQTPRSTGGKLSEGYHGLERGERLLLGRKASRRPTSGVAGTRSKI